MNITIKKDFKNMIFPLSEQEMANLENSIIEHGVKDPLIVWAKNDKNYLVDGHHRYILIQRLKIKKYKITKMQFNSKTDAINFILDFQMARRNCTPEALSYLRGLRYKNEKLKHGTNRYTSKSSHNGNSKKTAELLAEQYKVGKNTILRDEKFTDAVDTIIDIFPTPSKKKQVKNDLLTKQYKLSKKDISELSTLPAKYIKDVIDNDRELWQARSDYNKEQKRKDLKKASKKSVPDNVKLYTGDCLKLSKKHLKAGSIDCILTDPPFADMQCYDKLGQIAEVVLKESGFCCCYIGTMYLPQVMNIMSKYLDYYWQIILLHSGSEGTKFKSQTLHGRKVDTAYKSILIFQKPPVKKVKSYFNDVIQGGGMEKEHHPWQQAEEELIPLIETFSTVNDTVLDLFLGSGTVGVMSARHHRKFVGFDIDRQCVAQARARIQAID